MITEDYCSYEVSKLLKEKGFNVPCLAHWHIGNDGHEKFSDYPFNWNEKVKNDLGWLSCPTHQTAMKWLRKVYDIFIKLEFDVDEDIQWHSSLALIKGNKYIHTNELQWYDTYEQAVEVAIKYCLENLI